MFSLIWIGLVCGALDGIIMFALYRKWGDFFKLPKARIIIAGLPANALLIFLLYKYSLVSFDGFDLASFLIYGFGFWMLNAASMFEYHMLIWLFPAKRD